MFTLILISSQSGAPSVVVNGYSTQGAATAAGEVAKAGSYWKGYTVIPGPSVGGLTLGAAK